MSAAIEALASLQIALADNSLDVGPYVERATDELAKRFALVKCEIGSVSEIAALTIDYEEGPVTCITHGYAWWLPSDVKRTPALQLSIAEWWWQLDVFDVGSERHMSGEQIGADVEPMIEYWEVAVSRWRERARMETISYRGMCCDG